jgi:phosphomannomutase
MSTFAESIFRAYDMRGVYPTDLNEEVAYAAGQAFVRVMNAKKVVVARDVRPSGVSLSEALVRGITEAGADAIEIGVVSTEMLYFASATLECDGGMSITASHNPKEWNGIKFIGKDAQPLMKTEKLGEIYEAIKQGNFSIAEQKGTSTKQDLTTSYIQYLHRFAPTNIPHLKIVANVNFGANGQYVDAATEGWPIEMVRLNWEQDGTFPKGTPDPSLPKNRDELSARIASEQADFGVAWDADADRCFFMDDKGRFFHGYYITAMLARHFLEHDRGGSVVIDRRLAWASQEAASENGGKAVYSRTGHGFVKRAMRDNNAIFGGESSGHFYYRDYFYCDSGLITFLSVFDIFAKSITNGRKVSDLLNEYMEKYPITPAEMNYITPQAKEIIEAAAQKYSDAAQDRADGITIEYSDWRFNLRMSDNEPVMRLNAEAKSQTVLTPKLDELTKFIESFGATLRNDNA